MGAGDNTPTARAARPKARSGEQWTKRPPPHPRARRLLGEDGRARLEDLLLRVGALVEQAPEIVALELNPVIVSPSGIGVADLRLQVAPVERHPRPPVRRL